MLMFNVLTPMGLQRRSKLEKAMRDWFNSLGATTNKCVLCGPGGIGMCGPGGIGKSTLVRNFAAACAAGTSDALDLVFVLSATNMEQDYLGENRLG